MHNARSRDVSDAYINEVYGRDEVVFLEVEDFIALITASASPIIRAIKPYTATLFACVLFPAETSTAPASRMISNDTKKIAGGFRARYLLTS